MRISVVSVVLALVACSTAIADEHPAKADEEARALVGKEYIGVLPLGQRIAPDELSCTTQGGEVLHSKSRGDTPWAWSVVRCQDRLVLVLERKIGEMAKLGVWRIVDALLLPPVTNDKPDPELLWLTSGGAGDCEWQGRAGTPFYAAVRFGQRRIVDWHSGVEHVWTVDLAAERIVAASPEGVVCERLEP